MTMTSLGSVPRPGDRFAVRTGDATVIESVVRSGRVFVLCRREHSHHPYVTWRWMPGHPHPTLLGGHYFADLPEAAADLHER